MQSQNSNKTYREKKSEAENVNEEFNFSLIKFMEACFEGYFSRFADYPKL